MERRITKRPIQSDSGRIGLLYRDALAIPGHIYNDSSSYIHSISFIDPSMSFWCSKKRLVSPIYSVPCCSLKLRRQRPFLSSHNLVGTVFDGTMYIGYTVYRPFSTSESHSTIVAHKSLLDFENRLTFCSFE